ncbi:MAG: YfcE family phosphodiesterase [Candidatus Aenigmarchaeota archaeon]|nr:YfcE family phosphodiesterase [Candidatus Aenigmarchaeota archaeon]
MKQMRIGIFGDAHIPDRAFEIPDLIKKELYACDMILCTGDLTGEEVVEFVKNSGKPHKMVRGNMDHLDLPKLESIDIEGKKIVIIHSDEVKPRGDRDKLFAIAERYNADILLYGHTHEQDVWELNGKIFVNPGSATGLGPDGNPHCAIIEMGKNSLSVKKT